MRTQGYVIIGAMLAGSLIGVASVSGSIRSRHPVQTAMGRKPQAPEKSVYRCPRCGMTFDQLGVCPMDNTKLEKVPSGSSKSG